jgi:hypothetical protein
MTENRMPDFSLPEVSEFITLLNRLRDRCEAFRSETRPLTDEETARLTSLGNTAEDWSAIQVTNDFSPVAITNSRFFGTCHLGVFDGTPVQCTDTQKLPSGIHDSIISNATIGNGCCLWNAKGVSNYFLDENTVLYNTGTIACGGSTSFGNGTIITIGMETGGRKICAYADLTIPAAAAIVSSLENAEAFRTSIGSYLTQCETPYGIIGGESRIINCPSITDTFIGEAVVCDNVTRIHDTTIAGNSNEPTVILDGALIRNSIIQWGCRIASMAIVERSVCTEHSHVERHAKVTNSIIGPNTGIAEGEVTASLVGPFVGFHHQALLIGALWPEGHGNVAYGANVGSNHTAKAPDQEIYCGEGLFFGLGVNIKFPVDFSRAPYSIIATGVTTLPQRMSFPFSLINTPSRYTNEFPPAYNELFPGWVLSDNLYAVYRNEAKFRARDTAHRSGESFEMFRPEIIDMIVAARNGLQQVDTSKEFYTDADVPGAGKNFITVQNLQKAIGAYSEQIELYCLNSLFSRCLTTSANKDAVDYRTLWSKLDAGSRQEHEQRLFTTEGFDRRSLRKNLERLAELVGRIAAGVAASKEKDDVRGRKIMASYDAVHAPAAEDAFVKETTAKCAGWIREIEEFTGRVGV